MSVSVEGQTSSAGEGFKSSAPRLALSRVRPAALRQRDLERLGGIYWPVPISRTDYVARLKHTAHLRRFCRRMRTLGLEGHHAYSLPLHEAALRCLDMERREIAILKANSEEIAA